ncbi:MAG: Fic family protein [Eubacterium sp.]|nr:Fic family protein [Eubacterium sp.]
MIVHLPVWKYYPFSEGNGRTSRSFMNMQLVRARVTSI